MIVAGVDEAGRGPLAGPVVAAAVVLTPKEARDLLSLGLRDSKKLSASRREGLFKTLLEMKVPMGIQAASWRRVDEMNVLNASLWAMERAVARLCVRPQVVLVDGAVPVKGLGIPQRCVVKGDSKVPAIMAASVVAKVIRDRVMEGLHRVYPRYRFDRHKGYPTELHRRILEEIGPSPVHRVSFSVKLRPWDTTSEA
ncbi:ribonuclease HII [Thermanaerovibrio velox DSM 12556]|uniref:Ribonuclease HII n=1 Tax=Thermanaerovibrio velox DSM 12556 TaxID=926567 RepID=H0UPM6_9BACT|nr:ribonuclease HII [Thermanaerovibrio velox]EHM09573.1 ribonuclease HII [Thermanaerovibrio velox DSM 12556]